MSGAGLSFANVARRSLGRVRLHPTRVIRADYALVSRGRPPAYNKGQLCATPPVEFSSHLLIVYAQYSTLYAHCLAPKMQI